MMTVTIPIAGTRRSRDQLMATQITVATITPAVAGMIPQPQLTRKKTAIGAISKIMCSFR